MRLFLLSLLLATLGNADVVKLVKAGLSVETIEAKIAKSDTAFDTSTDALIALADAGVPDQLIRTMIEYDAAPPVPPAPPVAPTPAAAAEPAAPAPPLAPVPPSASAPTRVAARRYDVTVHGENRGKCDAELRIDGKGIKASRCRALDFEISWRDLDRACYVYGFRGTVVLEKGEREYRISTTTPAEAQRLVEHIRLGAPSLVVSECR